MKNSPYQLVILFFLALVFPNLGTGQVKLSYDLKYEVNKVLPALSITRDNLIKATTVADLNVYYKSSWIRSYNAVEISAIHKGVIKKEVTKNDTLSQAQKELMNLADVGTDITAKVKYLPENTLAHNEMKEMNFTFLVDPEIEAAYVGGSEELNQYLEDSGIDKISNVEEHNLAAVKFAVNEEGQVIDVQVVESSKDAKVDQLLLEIACNMPDWHPAAYADGTRVKQEFVLTVGDHRSCVVNLLNIRRLDAE